MIKIKSNKKNFKIIKEIIKAKIPVMGHIGFTPQFKKNFNVEGKNKYEIKKLIKEALLIEKAGAFSIVFVAKLNQLGRGMEPSAKQI